MFALLSGHNYRMNLITWLEPELKRRGWQVGELARQADLDPTFVEAVLSQRQPPDFEFCYGVAQALDKQPERVLHMAGLLSAMGLKVAMALAMDKTVPSRELRAAAGQLPADERRLLLACISRQGRSRPVYNEIRLAPGEFNQEERTQDRIRFALLVAILVLLLVGISLGLGFFLSG